MLKKLINKIKEIHSTMLSHVGLYICFWAAIILAWIPAGIGFIIWSIMFDVLMVLIVYRPGLPKM